MADRKNRRIPSGRDVVKKGDVHVLRKEGVSYGARHLGELDRALVEAKERGDIVGVTKAQGTVEVRGVDPDERAARYRADDGPADPVFDVPLANGGPIALLMCADLSTTGGADRVMSRLRSSTGSRPSLEQLQMAQDIGRALNAAILYGHAPAIWKLVAKARELLFGIEGKRVAILNLVHELVGYWENEKVVAKKFPTRKDEPGQLESRCDKAIQQMAALDDQFASLRPRDLAAMIGNDLEAVGLATKLSIACGAFGDVLTEEEKGRKLTQQERRIRGRYEAALRVARGPGESTT